MSLQALIAVHSHKTSPPLFSYLFPVEDKDEPCWRVAGRRAAFRLECLADLVGRPEPAQAGSFLRRYRHAHVRLAVDREETRTLRRHLATVRPHQVHLTCKYTCACRESSLFNLILRL